MARLIGWHVMRRTGECCDDCAGFSTNERPVWLVSMKPVVSNHVRCACEPCLRARLDEHLREQARLDSEEHQHGEAAT